MSTRGVVVLDLREGACDVRDAQGSVLVLDRAESAAEHDEVYQALLGNPLVSGVICLAVDGGRPDGEVRVRPAPSLAPVDRAATLWIGDRHGVRWRPADHCARGVRPAEPSGLDQLVDALAEPVVFDAVLKAVGALPFSTAGIGLALERTSLGDAELRRVQDEAITHFTDPLAGRATLPEPPREEFRAAVRAVIEVNRAEDVLVPGGALDAARARAAATITAANHELTRLNHPLAPLPRQRAGLVVGAAVAEAREAARDLHDKVTRQLLHVDDALRGRAAGPEPGLGAVAPVPARPRQVRDDARHLVEGWLRRYRSIPHLLADLGEAGVEQEPQGCLGALEELAGLAPPKGPGPAFEVRPLQSTALLLAVSTAVLTVVGAAPAVFTGGLALAWFGLGWLLHARRPTATGEVGPRRGWKPALAWALPGLLTWVVVLVPGAPEPAPWAALPTLLAVLVFAWTALTGWRRAVRRWRRALDLDDLRARVTGTEQLLDAVLRTEWRQSSRRALFAEGLRQVGEGLTAIRQVLADRADDLFTPPADRDDPGHDDGPERDVYEEVRDVVVTDLVDLTTAALRPCWAGIEAGRPGERADFAARAGRLVDTYRGHVEDHGLLAAPPFASRRDHAHRDTLATRLWAGSRVEEALSRGVEDEMTQLCHARHLGAVSALASGARLVRFASTAVRGVTPDAGGPGPAVTWTGDTEIAGTLRLVPLRQGVFG
ncbi:hypothetical protein [Saccharothrix syringae]|uniref:Uncharacterized protein n=1 Tax=Saccharothrix syringae TaxID=103733 RepID=A0A5Q0H0J0_SACSY|nr:hypothetical protein [Saccharothrix syringae]QFZ19633.1 hypothetical protein EKG83_21320 [Saccharothrix syringae]